MFQNMLRKISFRFGAIYGYFVFRQWGLYIKFNSKITGAQYIKVDGLFGAGDYFWLAAIDDYNGVKYQPQIKFGNNVSLSDFCHIAAINKIEIGSDVLIGSRVHITDHSHGSYIADASADSPESIPIFRKLYSSGPVKIGNKVWIGDGVVILPNVTVGDGAVIGAGSMVTKNVEAGTMVVGVPAKIIKTYINGFWRACKNVKK